MIVTEETKRVAQEAYDYIITHPEQHNQRNWLNPNGQVNPQGASYTSLSALMGVPLTEENLCDTTMCVAGTVDYLNSGMVNWGCANRAADLLGLEVVDGSFDEIDALFYNMDNETALNMLLAIAQGDPDKFYHLAER
jgi:hypothetical protein